MKRNLFALLLLFAGTLGSCKKDNDKPEPVVVQGNGSVQDEIDQFRQLLGPLNTGGQSAAGRREVNWDGVPEEMLGKPLPNDFFNPTGPGALAARQRGLTYTGIAGEFVVSKTTFAEINTLAAGSFRPFSGANTFANTTSSLWEVGFQVPGQRTAATVRGFGAVFSDVDEANSSFLEFFNEDKSLGKFFIPIHDSNSSFSFLGVIFPPGEQVTRVAVNHPGILNARQADISNGGPKDLIVFDDFIYSEPIAKP